MDIGEYIQELDRSTEHTLAAARAVSPDALTRHAHGSWSILGVLEHIHLTDRVVYTVASRPTDKRHSHETAIDENEIRSTVGDRSRKLKAPPFLEPKGKFESVMAFEAAFVSQRELLKEGLRSGRIVVDNRMQSHPWLGEMTVADWLRFLVHHTGRHIRQIDEIAAWSAGESPRAQ